MNGERRVVAALADDSADGGRNKVMPDRLMPQRTA
jgi:hypothetical protein